MHDNTTTLETSENIIEQALAAAKAARIVAVKDDTETLTAKAMKTDEDKEAEKVEKERVQAEKKAAREVAKAEKKAAREVAKAEKQAAYEKQKAARAAERANYTPHMAKVEKAASNLPELTSNTETIIDNLTALSNSDLSVVIAHAEHQLRVNSTIASQDHELFEGQLVKITSGPAQFLGLSGTVSELRRIRVLIDVPGRDKSVYLFRSDCTPVAGDSAESTEDEDDTSGVEYAESIAS